MERQERLLQREKKKLLGLCILMIGNVWKWGPQDLVRPQVVFTPYAAGKRKNRQGPGDGRYFGVPRGRDFWFETHPPPFLRLLPTGEAWGAPGGTKGRRLGIPAASRQELSRKKTSWGPPPSRAMMVTERRTRTWLDPAMCGLGFSLRGELRFPASQARRGEPVVRRGLKRRRQNASTLKSAQARSSDFSAYAAGKTTTVRNSRVAVPQGSEVSVRSGIDPGRRRRIPPKGQAQRPHRFRVAVASVQTCLAPDPRSGRKLDLFRSQGFLRAGDARSYQPESTLITEGKHRHAVSIVSRSGETQTGQAHLNRGRVSSRWGRNLPE